MFRGVGTCSETSNKSKGVMQALISNCTDHIGVQGCPPMGIYNRALRSAITVVIVVVSRHGQTPEVRLSDDNLA